MNDWRDWIRTLLWNPGYGLPPLPRVLQPEMPKPDMTAEEVVALDVLTQHGFSRRRMAEEGALEDYLALGVDPDAELLWRGAYADQLLAGPAEALGAVLALAAEYGDAALLSRTTDALDDAVQARRIPDAEALTLSHALLDALESRPFADDPEALREGRIRVMELSDALTPRLADAGDAAQDELFQIRSRLEDAGVRRLVD